MFFSKRKKEDTLKATNNYRKTGLETNPSNYGWYTCVHCHKKFRKGSIDIDHIIPKSKGGTNDPTNLQCLCIHCNRSKGNDTTDTRKDLRTRQQSFNQCKRSKILKSQITQVKGDIKSLLKELDDQTLLDLINDPEQRAIIVQLKAEARRRGLM